MKNTKWNQLTLVLLGLILMAYESHSARASQSNLNKKEMKTLMPMQKHRRTTSGSPRIIEARSSSRRENRRSTKKCFAVITRTP